MSAMSAASSTAVVESSVSSPPRARRNVAMESSVSNPLVAESLKEFEGLDEEAADLGVAPPAPNVREAARRILDGLLREFPRYYAVSPGEGREVAIQASAGMGKGRGVLIVCDNKDISCYVTINGKNRRACYDREEAKNLPDEFIRAAMRQLE